MRPVFWYLVLVGLPVAATLGILRIGERLDPPRAVHGQYGVTFDSAGAGRCLSALVPDGDRRLGITQSGPRLDVTFGLLELPGTITRDSVYAAVATKGSALLRAAGCLTVDTVALSAVLPARGAGDAPLEGSVYFAGCTTCAAVLFRATRLAARDGSR